MMKQSPSFVSLMIGSFAMIAALAPAPQEVAKVKVGRLKELADSRAKVCERLLDFYRESLKAPPAPGDPVKGPGERYAAGYEPIQFWSQRLLEAKLDGAANLEGRIAVLNAEVERIKKFEDDIKALKDDPEWKVVADKVEFYRLEAEYRLAKEKGIQ